MNTMRRGPALNETSRISTGMLTGAKRQIHTAQHTNRNAGGGGTNSKSGGRQKHAEIDVLYSCAGSNVCHANDARRGEQTAGRRTHFDAPVSENVSRYQSTHALV